jgi:hypothetical protein
LTSVMRMVPLSAIAADDKLAPANAARATKAVRNPDESRMEDPPLRC